jgi:hypothetical protein
MKRIALGAVVVAAVGITACSHGTAPTTTPASHSTVTPVVQASCSQQYHAWGQGHGKGVIAALTTASVASTAAKPEVLKAELQKVRPAVANAARYPLPGCADPRGYWPVLLMHMTAAVSSTGSTAGTQAAMKGVPAIQRELVAELNAVLGTA